MSMPNIPDITPKIEIDREEALTLLLASIALEEMGLAHILNAEGEKMQFLLQDKTVCAYDLLAVNESIEQVIRSITKLQIVLQDKLDTVVRILPRPDICPTPKPPPPKAKCALLGCGVARVQNKADDFFGATATLEVKERQDNCCDVQYPLTYTLLKRGKGLNISAVLVPIFKDLQIDCGKKLHPCPTPEQPNFLAMQGKGIMCVQGIGQGKNQATVNFILKVWDYGILRTFQMVTWGENELYAHDSGDMEVRQGDLRIK
ncbi:MAG TPA: hypothetical protein VJZ70_01920 [Limnochordia bacterium]|nr:hypothetical protein [Limnochordia bacterium]